MARKHTPDELADANRLLDEGAPLIEQMEREEKEERDRDLAEISMLERRVQEEVLEVDLGHGDIIRCRACLSEREMREIERLQKEMAAGDQDAAYQMAEIITVNKLITADYLKENPGRWAVMDLLDVMFGFLEDRANKNRERNERVIRAATFRPNEERPGIR
jgi:hypothetical protein